MCIITSAHWLSVLQATNSVCQGGAADVAKRAMIELHRRLPPDAGQLLVQIHDELLFEVAEGRKEEVAALVRQVMGEVWKLSVHLPVVIHFGASWGDLRRY